MRGLPGPSNNCKSLGLLAMKPDRNSSPMYRSVQLLEYPVLQRPC